METMLAVIPTNWKYRSVSFSAGPMIHWMNSPKGKGGHFENIFSILNTSLIGSLCIDIVMMMRVIIMTMMMMMRRRRNLEVERE